MAEPWGRWVQDEVLDLRQAAIALGAETQNDGRASNATMDNISSQVVELYAQRNSGVPMANMTITPPQSAWTEISQTVSLPEPEGGTRFASILLSGVPEVSGDSLASTTFSQLSINGVVIARAQVFTGAASVPLAYLPSLQITGSFMLTPGSSMTFRLWSSKFTSDPGSITMANLQATITPAQLA